MSGSSVTLFKTTAAPWELGSQMKRVKKEMEDEGLNQWMHHKTSPVKEMRNNSRELDAGRMRAHTVCVCVCLEIMKHVLMLPGKERRKIEKHKKAIS